MRKIQAVKNKRRHVMTVIVLLFVASSASAQPVTQWCAEAESAILRPPIAGDRITVRHSLGQPYRSVLVSLDSSGRALLLENYRLLNETRIVNVGPHAFLSMLSEAREAEEAHRNRPEPDRIEFDTTTLDGLLEAVRAGSARMNCQSSANVVKGSISLYVGGEETYHYCPNEELAEFAQQFISFVEQAIDDSGEYLCQ